MTTLNEICISAFRESQTFDLERVPSDAELNEALARLKNIIELHTRPPVQTVWLGRDRRLVAERGQIVRDFTGLQERNPVPADTYVNLLLDQSYEVFLPSSPGDGSVVSFIDVAGTLGAHELTIVGNGNLISGQPSILLDQTGSTTKLMYRRDLAEWRPVGVLEGASQMPYPTEFDDFWIIMLAMRMNPRYGKEISPITLQVFNDVRSRFMSRYMSHTTPSQPDIIWTADNGNFGNYNPVGRF